MRGGPTLGRGPAAGLLFALAFAGSGCAALERAESLPRGERLYRSRCTTCHVPIPRGEYDRAGWQLALQRYGRDLGPEETRAILEYLAEGR